MSNNTTTTKDIKLISRKKRFVLKSTSVDDIAKFIKDRNDEKAKKFTAKKATVQKDARPKVVKTEKVHAKKEATDE